MWLALDAYINTINRHPQLVTPNELPFKVTKINANKVAPLINPF
jgi:hypothetical protein